VKRASYLASFLLLYSALGWADPTAHDIQQRVGVDPAIGGQVPLQTLFRDEAGTPRRLGDVIAGRPTILALVYFDCPNLCTLTLNGLATSSKHLGLRPAIDYRVIAISIDPREGPALAAAKRDDYAARFGRGAPGCAACDSGWHFLTGEQASIRQVAQAVGYRYFWDAAQSQYAHPAGAVVLSGAGRIVQYLNGVEFPATELRRALSLAAAGRTGSLAQRLWLLCFHYEALTGRYGGDITMAVRVLGLLTMVGLGWLLLRLMRIRT
jgi:protein SCO1/2